jgi:transposase
MARKPLYPPLDLDEKDRELLEKLSASRTAAAQEVERAKILLMYANKLSVSVISSALGTSRPTIYKWIDKALASGVREGLKDKYHRPKEPLIGTEAKLWVVNLACKKPKDLGYAAELWSYRTLAGHTRQHTPYPALLKAGKATICRILKEQAIKPHKIRYYLEKRDEQSDEKMKDILAVYREVNLINAGEKEPGTITVSIDEKPGVQAIANTAPDLPPVAGKYSGWARDYEYKRLGTVSILAALDLQDGHITCQVHDKHRSQEFVELLKALDSYYAEDLKIRIILDNHSAHISKETMGYLKSRPNRFIYVHTPKHGSWLNIVETFIWKGGKNFPERHTGKKQRRAQEENPIGRTRNEPATNNI